MKTIVLPAQKAAALAAERILEVIAQKKRAAVALSAGDFELKVWDTAAALAREKELSFLSVRFYAAGEFAGIRQNDENSVRQRLLTGVLFKLGLREDSLLVPEADGCSDYDRMIGEAGGIDLAVLGIGTNARIAFNEPATPFASHTHLQKLTGKTLAELSPCFGGEDRVPQQAVTMGFAELCSAKEILVVAAGEERSEAVFNMLYGRDDSVYPAAFLQIPPNVTVIADTEAAKKL